MRATSATKAVLFMSKCALLYNKHNSLQGLLVGWVEITVHRFQQQGQTVGTSWELFAYLTSGHRVKKKDSTLPYHLIICKNAHYSDSIQLAMWVLKFTPSLAGYKDSRTISGFFAITSWEYYKEVSNMVHFTMGLFFVNDQWYEIECQWHTVTRQMLSRQMQLIQVKETAQDDKYIWSRSNLSVWGLTDQWADMQAMNQFLLAVAASLSQNLSTGYSVECVEGAQGE